MHKNLKYRGDYVGMRFGKLTVIGYPTGRDGERRSGAICRCDCGHEQVVRTMHVLFSGKKRQCKWCGYKQIGEARRRYCASHPTKASPYRGERLYKVWMGMKQRGRSNSGPYADVGVCDEWLDYPTFREWAYSHGYDDQAARGECTIDRINPFGDYEPSNCRWADPKTQARNKRNRWEALDEDIRAAMEATVSEQRNPVPAGAGAA